MVTYSYAAPGRITKVTVGENGSQLEAGRYDIVAYGGGGGDFSRAVGGKGAAAGGYFTLQAGEKLEIIAAGPGGGSGGGGGASQVFAYIGGKYVPLVVAGGGGGAGDFGNGQGATVGAPGSGTGGSYGGSRNSDSGTGGAGVAGNGGGGAYTSGGSDAASGGAGDSKGGGGFGGGGGGDGGGGGGGGYTGGNGGVGPSGTGGGGGTSFVSEKYGTADAAHTKVGAVAAGTAGKVLFTAVPVCFAAGTLIRVWRDGSARDIAVEALQVGDLALTASGATRPIRWLGHRTIDCRAQAQPRDVWPIRVAAHAFGDGLPATDLFLSAGHAVRVGVVGEVLIPIGKLVNGATIARHPVDEVTYWHVELDSHDVLIANGLPAESFLDCGNRVGLIEQEGDYDRFKAPHTPADFCLPYVDRGPVLDAVRDRLATRAESLGWTATRETGLHLLVDGVRMDPDVLGPIARFLFPAAANHVELASTTHVPSDQADVLDHRRLGVAVHGLEVDDGLRDRVPIALDDPRLAAGWHPEEAEAGEAHRFTTGRLALPASLWAGCRGQVLLRVHHDPHAGTRWLPPANTAEVVALREG